MKPLTATEIEKSWQKGCSCGKCEYCHLTEYLEARQRVIFDPLIKRTKQLIKEHRKG